jgi:hypothetical protein
MPGSTPEEPCTAGDGLGCPPATVRLRSGKHGGGGGGGVRERLSYGKIDTSGLRSAAQMRVLGCTP